MIKPCWVEKELVTNMDWLGREWETIGRVGDCGELGQVSPGFKGVTTTQKQRPAPAWEDGFHIARLPCLFKTSQNMDF